jgi:chlorophyllide a reductase subunit Y
VVAAAVHPFYTASVREFQTAGRPVVGSGPVGVDGTAAWLDAIGQAAGIGQAAVDRAKAQALPAIRAVLQENPVKGTVVVSGYEGSELLVARLLVEAGARVPYVGTACPRTEWSDPDREWLQAHGTHVQYRAALEQDIAAMREVRPDLALGTTPLVQAAKEAGLPAIYFTNMVSARPLFGPAGAGALPAIVAAQTRGRERFNRMVDFFGEVGSGHAAGYGFAGKPAAPPKAKPRTTIHKAPAAQRVVEEPVGT